MKTWRTELTPYLNRLDVTFGDISGLPPHPPSVPYGALEFKPSPLQSLIHRAVWFFEFGIWSRAQETAEAISTLWKSGCISSGATMARLLFEIWGAARYLSETLSEFVDKEEFDRLEGKVNKIVEGVRSEVLMPWGVPAAETPIHLLDTIRGLKPIYPKAMETYQDLCESAHANLPRFMEWWVLGKAGDNWTNETVQKRGHGLLTRTIESIEAATSGIKTETVRGLSICDQLYCRTIR